MICAYCYTEEAVICAYCYVGLHHLCVSYSGGVCICHQSRHEVSERMTEIERRRP